ncbi:MAG: ribosomal protein S18 acetylase RimI-like enzyme [Phycisphaerales bacterium]
MYPGDDGAGTLHLAIREPASGDRAAGEPSIVSVGSFYLEAVPESVEHAMCGVLPGSAGVRIRGMATLEGSRGRGYGRGLVRHGVELLQQRGTRYDALWCNARTSAAGYYERLGFVAGSALFELPDIGEHVVMVRAEPQAR